MSIPDALIVRYMELATAIARDEIAATASGLASEATNPRDAKVRLAKALVTQYHSAEAAEEAARWFAQTFSARQFPGDADIVRVDPDTLESGGQVGIIRLITMCGKGAISSSEAGRLVAQGGVKVDGEAISDRECRVSLDRERRLQVGKRRFYLVSRA
jgi:tyrosyl-tRNA synthetase